jgi:hypothetical protein
MRAHPSVLLSLLATFAWAGPAHAAKSYDNCTGFITAVPAVISTPGTWCLKQDVSTTNTLGYAIDIQADNVVLDCNDFLVDGLAGGSASNEQGIHALNRKHATVRHCNVRGFFYGVNLDVGGSHYVVEDNHFTEQMEGGIRVAGSASVVRRNLVSDVGGTTVQAANSAFGILVDASNSDIVDNKVIGVMSANNASGEAYGLLVGSDAFGTAANVVIERNEFKGLVASGPNNVIGIAVGNGSPRMTIRNNDIENGTPGTGFGIVCSANPTRVQNNTIYGFATAIESCGDAGENDTAP